MRIAYLIPEFPGQTHVLFWREIKALRALGVHVSVVSTRRPDAPGPHDFSGADCVYLWPPKRWVPKRGAKSLLKNLEFVRTLNDGGLKEKLKVTAMLPSAWTLSEFLSAERIDYVHVHSFANSSYLAALTYADVHVRYGLVLHGSIENYGLNHDAKLRNASIAFGVNELTASQISKISGRQDVPVVSCGVPLDVFTYKRRNKPSDQLRVVTVARVEKAKGIDLVVRAIAELRGKVRIHYTVVGAGSYESELLRLISDLDLEEHVTLAGAKTEVEIATILHDNDVAILASFGTFETTAIFVREAMATGLPVIMSDVGSAKEMIEDYKSGLIVKPRDINEIALALEWFWDNRALLPDLGERASSKARSEFGMNVTCDRLVNQLFKML